MKLRIATLAALTVVAVNQVCVAEQTNQNFVITVADRVGAIPPSRPVRLRHGFAKYRLHGVYPVACEAVIFPRSALCAGRPASFGPYAPHPWNLYVYY